jgi:hypothetical protein
MARKPFSVPLPASTRSRIEALTAHLEAQATPQGLPAPSLAFVARQAIELGLDALEKRHPVTAPTTRTK